MLALWTQTNQTDLEHRQENPQKREMTRNGNAGSRTRGRRLPNGGPKGRIIFAAAGRIQLTKFPSTRLRTQHLVHRFARISAIASRVGDGVTKWRSSRRPSRAGLNSRGASGPPACTVMPI